MKIPLDVSSAMFKHANVNRECLHSALIEMSSFVLHGKFLKDWNENNPTRYFDYVVTEWLLHFVAPIGSFAFRVQIPEQDAKHYFARWPDGTIVDLTAEQFPEWELVNYATAKKASLPDSPSSRARILENLMQVCHK